MPTISKSSVQFCSDDLQKAVDSARDVLENLDENRNRISNDIKKLETFLETCGLKESFRFTLGKGFSVPEGANESLIHASLEGSGHADGEVVEECLVWGPHDNGRFRLLYEFNKWVGYVEVDAPGGPLFWDEATLVRQTKPLIEAKFDIRKSIFPRLPDFVRALSRHLRVELGMPDAGFNPDEIPF